LKWSYFEEENKFLYLSNMQPTCIQFVTAFKPTLRTGKKVSW